MTNPPIGEYPVSGQHGPQSLQAAAAELRRGGYELTSRSASMAERFTFCERKADLLGQIALADTW